MEKSTNAPDGAHRSRRAFNNLLDSLRDAADIYLDPNRGMVHPIDQVEGFEYLFHLLSAGVDLYLLYGDPERPEFVRLNSTNRRWVGDNPDAIYYFARIRDDRSYRIRGKKGDECYLSFTVHGRPDDGRLGFGGVEPVLADLNDRSLDITPDGSYEIILSPEEHPGNWIPLQPSANCILTRHYFEREKNAGADPGIHIDLHIEPLDPPPVRSLTNDEILAKRIADIAAFMRGGTIELPEPYSIQVPFVSYTPNELPEPYIFRMAEYAAWAAVDIAYAQGQYQLGPDEALIIEGRFPECAFANVVLWNRHVQVFEFRDHPVSLNRKQTVLETDGSYRIVIAHHDPGVPNWLDTIGHPEGTIFWRFLLPEEQPAKPQCTVVKFAEIAINPAIK